MVKITIVALTYNGGDVLDQCVYAIRNNRLAVGNT